MMARIDQDGASYRRRIAGNAAQIAYWGESAGPHWCAAQEALDRVLAPLGDLALERGAPQPGERVLDVGCGCGDSALALSDRVGPAGQVLGVDVSAPMLARAADRVGDAGRANISLVRADAQTHEVTPPVDLVYSRFGVMFFADPLAAFENLRLAMAPGGRLAFVCWQPLEHNRWMAWPLSVVERHAGAASQPGPGEPGPFAFGDPEHIGSILDGAGFVDVTIEGVALPLRLGADVPSALAFVSESVGQAATLLRESTPEIRAAAVDDLRDGLAASAGPDGISLDAAVWVVGARRATSH